MKEQEPSAMTVKENYAALFLLDALPTTFLRNATHDKALERLHNRFKKLPAMADKLKDRQLRTQVREIKPFDFCNVSLKLISSYSNQAIIHRQEPHEFERFDHLSYDWTKRRALSADLVHYLENNSVKLDCTVI